MSNSMSVFVNKAKLPSVDELRNEVEKMGLKLEEWDEQLVDIEGYWPGEYKSQEAGFEFGVEEIDEDIKADLEDWEVNLDDLGDRDYLIDLVFREEIDVDACVICIVALCKLSDAISFDEDEELNVNSETCIKWAKEEMGVEI